MAAPAPYQFDGVFALDVTGEEKPAITEAELAQAREEARTAAYAEGHAAGHAQAKAEQEAQLNQAVARLFDQIPDVIRTADKHMRETEDSAVEIAVISARKLSRALIAKFPLVEIVDLVRQSFDEIRQTPHVVLHINEELSGSMAERIDKLSRDAGIEGRLIVMGDPDILPGDARIEWADGGMARDLPGLEARIDDAVKRFVLSRRTIDPDNIPTNADGGQAHGHAGDPTEPTLEAPR
jgi:flagellar assembly protein FliH